MNGCIYCIQERRPYAELEKPITITCNRIGLVSRLFGECCNGHVLEITPKKTLRQYDATTKDVKFVQKHRPKYINYDTNILVSVAAYLNGDGESGVSRFVHALGIPLSHKMFPTVSKAFLCPKIIEITRKIVFDSLIEEIRQTLLEDSPKVYEKEWVKYKKWLTSGEAVGVQPTFPKVGIVVSTDMGWQKRSSGNRYDSPSGHILFIGARTKSVVNFKVFSTNCATCDKKRPTENTIPHHICPKNFVDSPKAMEATGAKEMTIDVYDKMNGYIWCKNIIADDDSTMKSYCSHSQGLPQHVPEPIFLADPSHRCKVVARPIFKLANAPMKVSLVTKSDALRIKLYYSYFIRSNRIRKGVDVNWMVKHVWCVIEHMFDKHHLCTSSFCWKRREEEELETGSRQNTEKSNVDTEEYENVRIIDTIPDEALEVSEMTNEGESHDNEIHILTQETVVSSSQASGSYSNNEEKDIASRNKTRGDQPSLFLDEVNESSQAVYCQPCDIGDRGDNTILPIPDYTASLSDTVHSNQDHDEEDEATTSLKALRKRKGYYRNKERDREVYEALCENFERFTTRKAMLEVLHPHDTQLNEAMNNAFSYVAPKNKNYSRSMELNTRISMVIGMHNVGKYNFMKRLVTELEMTDKNQFLNSLRKEDRKKTRKQIQQKKPAVRGKRVQKRKVAMLNYRKKEVHAIAKNTTYGVPKAKRKKVEEGYCKYKVYGCEFPGHKTAVAKNCKFHDVYKRIQKTKMSSQKKTKQIQLEIERLSMCDMNTERDVDVGISVSAVHRNDSHVEKDMISNVLSHKTSPIEPDEKKPSSHIPFQVETDNQITQDKLSQNRNELFISTLANNGMKRLREPLSARELYILRCTTERVDSRGDNDVVFTYKLRTVTGGSIRRLQGRREWLNDEILNYYFTLLKKRNDSMKEYSGDDHNCTFFSTWFYEKLMGITDMGVSEYNYEAVKKYTSRYVDGKSLFKFKKVFIPINVGSHHWICGVVDIDKKQVRIYDSFKEDRRECAEHLKMFMEDEEQRCGGKGTNTPDDIVWTICTSHIQTHPTQNNGWDCGVYVCLFADYLSLQLPLSFDDDNISLVRQRMIISLSEQFPICVLK